VVSHRIRGRLIRAALALLILCSGLVGLGGSAGAASQPGTALAQLRWFVSATANLPVPDAVLAQHFSASALQAAGGPDKLNQILAELGPLTFGKILDDQPTKATATVSTGKATYLAAVAVDATGLIDSLVFASYLPAPTSWSALDTQLRALAPQVSFAASEIQPDGQCRTLYGDNANTDRPLGSAFKLYVLGALGQAIAEHEASWTEQLAIHENWKSLPSGVLQNDPAGTKLTLRQYADYMISISDNTAADHLIHFLGRDAVQAQLFRFGNHDPAEDIPFLTTRELFVLKGVQYPKLADAYLATPRPARAAVLFSVDQVPLSQVTAWPAPEDINQLEWFAAPTDICRAYSGLLRENANPGLSPIGAALSINDGGIGLDRAQYPTVWFKGGSEPGVITLNYLARAKDGRVLVDSVMLANPTSPLDENTVIGVALALARGGIQLADAATTH
jgi:Beta-lactamase enzyme family